MRRSTFQIVVRGVLSDALIASIDGFTVRETDGPFTHLVGSVPDQAALIGVLEWLRDLTVEIISVNPVAATGDQR